MKYFKKEKPENFERHSNEIPIRLLHLTDCFENEPYVEVLASPIEYNKYKLSVIHFHSIDDLYKDFMYYHSDWGYFDIKNPDNTVNIYDVDLEYYVNFMRIIDSVIHKCNISNK